MTPVIKAQHDLPQFLVSKTSGNGALLVALSKLYLAEKLETRTDDKQFTVYIIPDGRRGLVRLHPGASCERGIGREHVKSPDFHNKFDVYLKPTIDQWYFTFTIEEQGEVRSVHENRARAQADKARYWAAKPFKGPTHQMTPHGHDGAQGQLFEEPRL